MKQYIYHESGGQSFTIGNKCCHNYYTNPINKLNGSKPQPHFNIPTTPENGSELRFKQRTWNNILIMSGGQSFTIEKRCCHHYFTTPHQQAQCLQTSTIFHHLQHQKITNLMASTTSAVHYYAASNTIPSPTTLHMITITISNTKWSQQYLHHRQTITDMPSHHHIG